MKKPAGVSYVALLRGINVGGKNLIRMAALVETFQGLGLAEVRTYIQSGNVLFEAPRQSPRLLEQRLEAELGRKYRYEAKVVVRSQSELARIVRSMPPAWRRPDPATKYNVLFLRSSIDSPELLEGLAPKAGLEEVSYRPGVLFWSARTCDLGRTSMAKVSSRPIYQELTVRNLNTTRKLLALMAAAPSK